MALIDFVNQTLMGRMMQAEQARRAQQMEEQAFQQKAQVEGERMQNARDENLMRGLRIAMDRQRMEDAKVQAMRGEAAGMTKGGVAPTDPNEKLQDVGEASYQKGRVEFARRAAEEQWKRDKEMTRQGEWGRQFGFGERQQTERERHNLEMEKRMRLNAQRQIGLNKKALIREAMSPVSLRYKEKVRSLDKQRQALDRNYPRLRKELEKAIFEAGLYGSPLPNETTQSLDEEYQIAVDTLEQERSALDREFEQESINTMRYFQGSGTRIPVPFTGAGKENRPEVFQGGPLEGQPIKLPPLGAPQRRPQSESVSYSGPPPEPGSGMADKLDLLLKARQGE